MRKKQPKVIGSAVRSYRTGLGMTQSEVAELADVAPETLSRIERNKIAASFDLVTRIAAVLQVKIDDLVPGPGGKRVVERPAATQAVAAKRSTPIRPAEARLLRLVRDLDDAQVDEVVRALRTLMGVSKT